MRGLFLVAQFRVRIDDLNGKAGAERFVVNIPTDVAVEKVREKVEQEKRTAEERLHREQDDYFILKTKLTLKY